MFRKHVGITEMQESLWAWLIPRGISLQVLSLTKSNQGIKRTKKERKKKKLGVGKIYTSPHPSHSKLYQAMQTSAWLKLFESSKTYSFFKPFCLWQHPSQRWAWRKKRDEPTRQILSIFQDICSLVLPCSWRKKSWHCRTHYEGKPTVLIKAADHLGSAAEQKQNPLQQSNSFVNTAPGLWFPEG